MDFISLLFISLSLAMDAMAVSVTNGIKLKYCRVKDAFKMGLFFGIFQFIMPLLGVILGNEVVSFVGKMAPFISFGILAFLGIKMIVESMKVECQGDVCKIKRLKNTDLFLQAIATSIDALVVGVGLAMASEPMGKGDIVYISFVIGVIAFLCSFIGALAGKKLGDYFERYAEMAGGAVLILIGVKILVQSFL